MEAINTLVKVSLPNYLKNLPIPASIDGLGKLTGDQWLALVPFCFLVTFLLYATVKAILPTPKGRPPCMNDCIKKDNPKVVDLVQIEDMDKDKLSYCRCWKSDKFPLCDGSHNKHNDKSGDNVGPLVLKRNPKAKAK